MLFYYCLTLGLDTNLPLWSVIFLTMIKLTTIHTNYFDQIYYNWGGSL